MEKNALGLTFAAWLLEANKGVPEHRRIGGTSCMGAWRSCEDTTPYQTSWRTTVRVGELLQLPGDTTVWYAYFGNAISITLIDVNNHNRNRILRQPDIDQYLQETRRGSTQVDT